MIISVASGKGGTGKTTVAVNLALSLKGKIQLLDCDVEEPNADIFLKPEITRQDTFYVPKPVVEESKCTFCGKCSQICQYNAIAVVNPVRDNPERYRDDVPALKRISNGVKQRVLIFYELCHSCGACKIACPEDAIFEVDAIKGVITEGKAEHLEFVNGELRVSEGAPTPLIAAVKERIKPGYITIIDVSPGTACPVVEGIKDSDFCILVTEPTPFGLHDLDLAYQMCQKLGVPAGVVINRADVGNEEVDKYCKDNNIPVLMRIPVDKEIARVYSRGIPFVQVKPEYKQRFRDLLQEIEEIVHKNEKLN